MGAGTFFLSAALVLLAQTSPASEPDIVAFKGDSAVAYGDDGQPVFRGSREFVLRAAHNPEGRVTLYDAERQVVRVSDTGGAGVWLNCAELKPMKTACGAPAQAAPRRPSRGATARPVPLGAIPACPGDPRCPQL